MKQKIICITGQNGFLGQHLYNTLNLYPEKYLLKDFKKSFFESPKILEKVFSECDVIIHLAAVNRHENQKIIYDTNVSLVKKIISSLNKIKKKPHLIMSSSTQENQNNEYGKSKIVGRKIFSDWANNSDSCFTGMLIPNVYGPFCKSNYNSFVATFCKKLIDNETPKIIVDNDVELIYISNLVNKFIEIIDLKLNIHKHIIKNDINIKVSKVLEKLLNYKTNYIDSGTIPMIKSNFDLNIFNTLRSYIDYKSFFPKFYKENTDNRGSFVELMRTDIGGQFSFSTTNVNITRGNHFHTRKIERFSVIKGSALIQLRKVESEKIIEFELDGNSPSYVDMPIWYTHNIKNIGNQILLTNFWINEPYNQDDPDTYMLTV